MGRIRTIKPEFHKHEVLSGLPEPTHMLAAALLNYADDEGYFNAHPGLVKAECSPLREPSVTIPESLRLLSSVGYLELGTGADGKRYGRVTKFIEHQVISHAKPSKIKSVGISWDKSVSVPVIVHEPSALNGTGNGIERGMEGEPAPVGAPLPAKPISTEPGDDGLDLPAMLDRSDEGAAVRSWNVMAAGVKGMAQVQMLNPTRRKKLKARLAECGGLDGWAVALEKIAASKFLTGGNDRGWIADFDFVMQQKSFTRLMEGSYDNRDGPAGNAIAAALDKLYAEAGEADAR